MCVIYKSDSQEREANIFCIYLHSVKKEEAFFFLSFLPADSCFKF